MASREWRRVGSGEKPSPTQETVRFSDGRMGLVYTGNGINFDLSTFKHTRDMFDLPTPIPQSMIVSTEEGNQIGFSSNAPGVAILLPESPDEDGVYEEPDSGWQVLDTGGKFALITFGQEWEAIGQKPVKLLVDYYRTDDNGTLSDKEVGMANPFDGLNSIAEDVAARLNQ